MKLNIYNTQTRQKEVFQALDPENIKMYVCGPTVYNLVHIGNARPVVVFDTLFRVLKHLFPKVTYARNVTDIDDKIMKAAKENGEPISDLAARFSAAYTEDMARLNNLQPSITPYATEHVDEMVAMVETLVEKGHAYESQGHLLFDVRSMPDYGKLSNRVLEDMQAGARVEVADYKKYAGDFVLWKPSADEEPGWPSPWGRGRPGWHLECSAMIEKHLGNTIDIHGGGRDLIFPHHENELAQSQCAHGGEQYVRYWMHNGYVNIDGEKMSKSLGNFKTVRGLLEHYRGEVLRFALLSAQYRSDLDFSSSLLDQCKSGLDTLYCALRHAKDITASEVDILENKAFSALCDDLNTPLAISEVHQLAKEINKRDLCKEEDVKVIAKLKGELLAVGDLLGIMQQNPDEWFQGMAAETGICAEEVDALIAERQQAKLEKNYARADEIRTLLTDMKVVLEDSKDGTTWRMAD